MITLAYKSLQVSLTHCALSQSAILFVAQEFLNFLMAILFKVQTAKSQKPPCVFIPNGYTVGVGEESPLVRFAGSNQYDLCPSVVLFSV